MKTLARKSVAQLKDFCKDHGWEERRKGISGERWTVSGGGPFRRWTRWEAVSSCGRVPATVGRKLSSPTRAGNRFQEKAIPVLVIPQHALASSSGRFCFSRFYIPLRLRDSLPFSLSSSHAFLFFPVSSRFTSPRATGLSAPIKPRSLTPSRRVVS